MTGATGATGATGPQGPIGLTGATGPAGATATNQNAMLYNSPEQTVADSFTLIFASNQINSTGAITASGTNGVTLLPGEYLAVFAADASVAVEGVLGAALALGGSALAYAATSVPVSGAATERITLVAVLDLTAASTLTVLNNTGNTVTYSNATLTVTKLA